MKKILLLSAMSVVVFAFSSCKKDYNCVCHAPSINDNTEYNAETYKSVTKSDAKTNCEAKETNYQIVVPELTCEVK